MINFANMRKRLLFALIAIPLGWWAINSTFNLVPASLKSVFDGQGIFPGHILSIALIFIACYEYLRMLGLFYPENGFWLSYVWLGLQTALYLTGNSLPGYLGFYILMMFVAAESFFWGKLNQRKRWVRASLLFSGIAFLYIAEISVMFLYHEDFRMMFKTFSNPMVSQIGIVIVLASVFMCDTMAYFIGSFWGKHHFSTISPNKTVEGSVAGLATAILVSSFGWWFLASPQYPPYLGILMGLLTGLFAQAGDLLVSLIKRYFKVKDASDILPGHGGILDRFDSVFFTAPVIALFTWIVHKIAG